MILLSKVDMSSHLSEEEGFSLAVVLAMMAILMIVIAGAAPNLRQQAQREREVEAIFRGEQMARAIQLYARSTGTLPTKIDQLIEGVPRNGPQRLFILRSSAARDPLTTDGEWQPVAVGENALLQFQQSLMIYTGGNAPSTRDPLIAKYAVQMTNVVNLGSQRTSSPFSGTSPLTGGPFIGVASKSKNRSVMHFYGIEEHKDWIFTPLFR